MVTDPLSDLFTRIRNAQKAGHPSVVVPASTVKQSVLEVLLEEGYIDRVDPVTEAGGKKSLKIALRYDVSGIPVIKEIRRLSTPGKRRYVSKNDIPHIRGGLGLVVVSTPRGMLSDRQARQEGVGGELICSVF